MQTELEPVTVKTTTTIPVNALKVRRDERSLKKDREFKKERPLKERVRPMVKKQEAGTTPRESAEAPVNRLIISHPTPFCFCVPLPAFYSF